MADLVTDLGKAFNDFVKAGGVNTIAQLLNPAGANAGQGTLATNGGNQTVGGIPVTTSLDSNTKTILIIFIVALVALIGFAIFK